MLVGRSMDTSAGVIVILELALSIAGTTALLIYSFVIIQNVPDFFEYPAEHWEGISLCATTITAFILSVVLLKGVQKRHYCLCTAWSVMSIMSLSYFIVEFGYWCSQYELNKWYALFLTTRMAYRAYSVIVVVAFTKSLKTPANFAALHNVNSVGQIPPATATSNV